MNDIEKNATREAIENIISSKTVDLAKETLMDFFIDVPDKNIGNVIAQEVKELSFQTSVEYDEEDNSWTCYCSKNIFLDFNTIMNIEDSLDEIAKKHGGYSDGFGTFGNL
ncbi:ribonuclease E inhibitor RraB [Sulfurimonas sp. CS5]|uniref:ribonuclease E inhibitor RraB n=1 Tax=Sulfurimonas sp. CS5 TaxID=3391145 RepID=UPI0039ED0DC2